MFNGHAPIYLQGNNPLKITELAGSPKSRFPFEYRSNNNRIQLMKQPKTQPIPPAYIAEPGGDDNYKNPWKTVSSSDKYDNPWINVREDAVITPGGSHGIYGVVHFKSTAVGIIPVDRDQHTWLVGQYRYPLNEYSWEIPMGGADLNNSPLDGAMRELREETGLTAAHWHQLMKVHPSNSVSDEVGYIYVATDLSQGIWEPEETEQLIVKRLPLKDAVQMVLDNQITDCISVAGLLRLHIALQSRELSNLPNNY